jgi:heme/copper-type cytochrome/quinol oxidase subunit 2
MVAIVFSHHSIIHGILIELVWTITPGIILLFIAIPSYKLLYILDLIIDPVLTVKAIGRQWYWEYEYEYDIVSI